MTTIAQLPAATTVGPSDLLPLSQAGNLYSVSVSLLTENLQPLLSMPTGDLLGRNSTGAGAPEAVSVGTGLVLAAGTLGADGADHSGFPVQATMSLSDTLVINSGSAPGLLPVAALRGLFSAGTGVSIDDDGVVAVTVSSIAGPAGPQGPAGPAGATGPQGPAGAPGPGLSAPGAGNSASSIGASDYVAIWQNGANAWMPYGQFLGGQTINQLPAAGPAADSDELLVAQGSDSLSVQSFSSIWTYLQAKLPSFKTGVVELNGNTVLDATSHNNRILVASAPLTLTANFANMGSGFACTLINLSAGSITMGTGISSGSGGTSLPPGAAAELSAFSYSGGSLVWWSGIVPNAPTLTVGSIAAPAPGTPFNVGGGIFNDAPTALDYSINGGVTWVAAASPVITANAYSFVMPGLVSGTYTIQVRDHANIAVIGVSNSFTIAAPEIAINALPASVELNSAVTVSGTVSPGNNAVNVGISSSSTVAPAAWLAATVANGAWAASLTPSVTGTIYIWAQQSAETSVQAVSPAINVVAASLIITAPATGNAATALTVSGTVSPAADSVNVQLSTQNTAPPTSGWTAAVNSAGSFAASLTPSASGTYYAWAQDPVTGLTAVSAAIIVAASAPVTYTINNPGGPFAHGSGSFLLNGYLSPAGLSVTTQIALSTSNTVAPTSGWQQVSNTFSNNTIWGVYANTPATAGSYYVWVETTTGEGLTVSSFTVSIT
jgi:hypothetical protein